MMSTSGPSRVVVAGSRSVGRLPTTAHRDARLLYAASLNAASRSIHSTGLPLSLTSNSLRLRNSIPLRTITTEPHRSTPPPPIPVSSSSSSSTSASPLNPEQKLTTLPPPGAPPPSPPLPLNAIPPKITDVAADKVEQELVKKEDKPKGSLPARAWAVVKKEASHYWHGTKLLGQEIRISAKLQWKVLNGGTLTRRERRQLRRTTTDLLRLIPFLPFVIIPFMEFLLPVALKLFPNMLPSTFEGEFAAAEKQRKLLRVRIEMAKFLQETVRGSGLKMDNVIKSDEFKQFFRKVRSTGETPSQTDVVRVAKLFNDDVTLDNLSRPQLVSMCKYIGINHYGTDNFLKHQIRNRLERVRVDDMMIHAEGVDSLTTKELQNACQSRGIRFQGVSPARLREELDKWIELHYINGISGVLLVLSRAFNFEQKGDDVMDSLITTLSSLPENLINEAELDASTEATNKQRLEVLQQQQELIEDEAEQEQEEKEAREAEEAAKREAEESAKEAKAKAKAQALAQAEASGAPAVATVAPGTTGEPAPPVVAEAQATAEEDDARMTKEQLGELAEALNILTAKSSIVKERQELQSLLEDNLLSEAESKERPDDTDAKTVAVSKRVRSMIKKIDTQLEKYDEQVGSSLNVINTNAKGQISLEDLEKAFRSIKHAPPEEAIEKLGEKLDVDKDGFVELDHVVELAQDRDFGIGLEEEAKDILGQGKDIRTSKDVRELKPKREDIISDK